MSGCTSVTRGSTLLHGTLSSSLPSCSTSSQRVTRKVPLECNGQKAMPRQRRYSKAHAVQRAQSPNRTTWRTVTPWPVVTETAKTSIESKMAQKKSMAPMKIRKRGGVSPQTQIDIIENRLVKLQTIVQCLSVFLRTQFRCDNPAKAILSCGSLIGVTL